MSGQIRTNEHLNKRTSGRTCVCTCIHQSAVVTTIDVSLTASALDKKLFMCTEAGLESFVKKSGEHASH